LPFIKYVHILLRFLHSLFYNSSFYPLTTHLFLAISHFSLLFIPSYSLLSFSILVLFSFFMYDIQHCFICRPSDSTVSEDARIEPRTVATTALAVRRSNHTARSHLLFQFLFFRSYHFYSPLAGFIVQYMKVISSNMYPFLVKSMIALLVLKMLIFMYAWLLIKFIYFCHASLGMQRGLSAWACTLIRYG